MNLTRLIRVSRAAVLMSVLGLAGCNVIGVVADKVAGDRPLKPAYEPDKLAPLVVLAENYRSTWSDNSDAHRIETAVSERLIEHEVAPIIPSDKVFALRDRDPTGYRKLTVVQIGQALGAKQVIYIDLAGVSVGTTIGSDALKGSASANVKLIDVDSGVVLFPKDLDSGVGVAFESELRRSSYRNTTESVRIETIVGLSDQIARLFHSYRASDLEKLDSERLID